MKKVGLSGMIVLTALLLTAGTPLVARLVKVKDTFTRPCHTKTLWSEQWEDDIDCQARLCV